MDVDFLIKRFGENQKVVTDLVSPVSEAQMRWKPSPKAWSLLEVLNHLYDEEREDFRLRLDLTLHGPGEPWPPIDPEGWVVEREYNKRDPVKSLELFCAEREASLSWLADHRNADWDAAHEHPRLGVMRAGDLLASWMAHDYLHIRQFARLHFLYGESLVRPYSPAYAGGW
jgi:hypothetical protein